MSGRKVKLVLGERQAWDVFRLVGLVDASDDEEVGTMIGSRSARDIQRARNLPRVILRAIYEAEERR